MSNASADTQPPSQPQGESDKSLKKMQDNPILMRATGDYAGISSEEAFELLQTADNGLGRREAEKRLIRFGRNAIEESKENVILEFISRYWGPMPWLLELAMTLSLLLEHRLEGFIIFLLLTINAVIGFLHSRGSQNAIALLKKRAALRSKVMRDGRWMQIDASELVIGDILLVKLGDIVPSDVKIISGEAQVDESSLTGESLPADRKTGDMLYSGSVVRLGEARGVTVNTGSKTYFGRTAELVKIAKPKSHQEEIMLSVVRDTMIVGIAATIAVTAYAYVMHLGIILILNFAVIFLMGAVPVALPAVLTIVQAAAAMKLADEGAVVSRLDSIEDAASISILCLDKTGTITQNKLSIAEAYAFPGFTIRDVAKTAAMASRPEGMDLIDLAVLDYAKAFDIDASAWKQTSYEPFNPSTRRTEAVIEENGRRVKAIKGAVNTVFPMCLAEHTFLNLTHGQVDFFARKGYRTIAVAQGCDYDEVAIKLVGLLALSDPPRPDSRSMLERIRKLGIKPVMLTGDSLPIAKEVANQVGIGDKIERFKDLAGLTEDEQAQKVAASDGFAEIYPEDKFRIVKLLQSRGFMVGMTGDGVNDAPALKQAEMGIAVSNAADVAKAAASVVLIEPGLGVIVNAITRSRETFQRMLTWVINKVTKVIQVIGVLSAGFFITHEMVLSLLDMSLLIFANDFVTMSLATDNVKHTAAPNSWSVRNITLASLVIGGLLVVEGLIAVVWGKHWFAMDLRHLQTFMMLTLVFTSQFRVLIVRERQFFWSSIPGKALMAASLGSIAVFFLLGTAGGIVPRLPQSQVIASLALSAGFTLALDFPKYAAFRLVGL